MSKSVRNRLEEALQKIKITPEHTETGHFYRFHNTGQLFPSVTTKNVGIPDDWRRLLAWSARLAAEHVAARLRPGMSDDERDLVMKGAVMAHRDIFHEAGDVGSFGHSIVEKYLLEWMRTGVRPTDIRLFIDGDDARYWAIARSMEKFAIEWEVEPVASELLVASPKYGYAGTLDSLLYVKMPGAKRKQLVLGDWKSSSEISKLAYVTQVVAYAYALKELTGIMPERLIIVRLDKAHAKYEVLEIPKRAWKKAHKAFLASSSVYDWMKDGDEKMKMLTAKNKVNLNEL